MTTVHHLSRPSCLDGPCEGRAAPLSPFGRLAHDRVRAVHQDVPFTAGLTAAIDAQIADLAAWLAPGPRRAG